MTKNYFAYGSNMFEQRLRERVPSTKAIGVYILSDHDLRFHKCSSRDGSGKCDTFYTGNENDTVIGRLFTIDADEECKLDVAEGLGHGYNKKEVCVTDTNGESQKAFTYCADSECIDSNLRPYTWYKQHVLAGAEEGDFPSDYIAKIAAVTAHQDTCKNREAKEMALHNSAGKN